MRIGRAEPEKSFIAGNAVYVFGFVLKIHEMERPETFVLRKCPGPLEWVWDFARSGKGCVETQRASSGGT
jgi:hypothetical protein